MKLFRAFWFFAILLFVFFSIFNASIFWRRYLYNPTVVTIDRDYLNRNITFPPITFCPHNRLNETAAEKFLMWVFVVFENFQRFLQLKLHSKNGLNASQRADPRLKKFMKNLAHFNIHKLDDLLSERPKFFRVDKFLEVFFCFLFHQTFIWSSISFKIMLEISNKFPHNVTVNNETFFFSTIFTDELGMCFTFNSRISPFLSPKSVKLYFSVADSWLCRFQFSRFRKFRKWFECEIIGGNELFGWRRERCHSRSVDKCWCEFFIFICPTRW